jgi:diaminohydroxyphosphoribosylaminopyrimidine deaminase / 5-amino-6-(5-phosphoribosylamino)uracil reductase
MAMSNLDHSHLHSLIQRTINTKGGQHPNPAVGAMVVVDGVVVGEGYHQQAGQAHAEVIALNNAKDKAQGATLYITLEPCVHHGKTPPCVDAIIKAGIKKVVWAINDPNPKVSGKAAALLKQNGIVVMADVLPEHGITCICEFAMVHQHQRPYVYVKAAVSSNGMIAPNKEKLHYMTSKTSLQKVQQLRAWCQAICVGVGTINTDQPRLSIRAIKNPNNQPIIAILDPLFSIDTTWLTQTLDAGRKVVLFTQSPILMAHKNLTCMPTLTHNKQDNWPMVFSELYKLGVHGVLVEGGSSVFTSILSTQYFDALWIFKTPDVLDPKTAVPFIKSNDTSYTKNLVVDKVEPCENDVLTQYKHLNAI